MKTTQRVARVVALLLTVAVLAAACTKSSGKEGEGGARLPSSRRVEAQGS